ncbi:MAG: TauD/TfdA family dioxygenase [Acidobacteriota bacterium]
MSDPSSPFNRFKATKRQTVRLSQDEIVRQSSLDPQERFAVIEPNTEGLNLMTWGESNRELIDLKLLEHGAILFRGFKVESAEQFKEIARTISGDLLDYQERAAPRIQVQKGVYTSTEFPADQSIPMHHEMSYSHNWPTQIWFHCAQPAVEGGRTPIVDDRKVIHLIDPEVQKRFREKRVMYVRNYGEGVDLSWQDAFQTTDRSVVEEYCRTAQMEVEWRSSDRLRTRTVRQVYAVHPRTGETLWFNHAHMFHQSNLPAEVREALLSEFQGDELPRNSFYGDGSPIEDSILAEIRGVYEAAACRFAWQQGDMLLVDNFLVSHGREPFSGPRKILVAMANLYTSTEIA